MLNRIGLLFEFLNYACGIKRNNQEVLLVPHIFIFKSGHFHINFPL